MILLLENNIRGGISSLRGDRYVKMDEYEKIMYIDALKLYGHSVNHYLAYDEIKFDRNIWLEDISNTRDDLDIGYLIEVDLKYPKNKKEETKKFPFAPLNKTSSRDKFIAYRNKRKPEKYVSKKLIRDWTDKKK